LAKLAGMAVWLHGPLTSDRRVHGTRPCCWLLSNAGEGARMTSPATPRLLLLAAAGNLVVVVNELVFPVLAVVVVDLVLGVDLRPHRATLGRSAGVAGLDAVQDLVLDLDRLTLEVVDLLDLLHQPVARESAGRLLADREQAVERL